MTSTMSTVPASDGTSLAWRERGTSDGPAIALLHSLGTDGQMWEECARILERDCRLLIPDTRGHGRSGPAPRASVDMWAEDLHRVLGAAGADDVLLVGISMGGIQALACASTFPEHLRGIVVADSFVALPSAVAQAKIDDFAGQARKFPMDTVADNYVADTFEHPYPPGAKDVRDAIAAMPADSYVAAVRACFSVQMSDRLAEIGTPTLVLWGDRDTKAPRPLSEHIVDGVARAEFGVVPHAGHLSNVDNPAAFAAAVLAFSAACDQQADVVRGEGGR